MSNIKTSGPNSIDYSTKEPCNHRRWEKETPENKDTAMTKESAKEGTLRFITWVNGKSTWDPEEAVRCSCCLAWFHVDDTVYRSNGSSSAYTCDLCFRHLLSFK
jgi:hypothetical protein